MILPISNMVSGAGAVGYAPGGMPAQKPGQAESAGRSPAAWPQDAYLDSDPTEAKAGTYSPQQILRAGDDRGMSPEEADQARELQQRDQEVRQHEQSHMALLGPYATGPATYSYQIGPDGKAYAVGGSVGVDMSRESGDAANATKAMRIRMAAGGVESPSAADMAVSGQASRMNSFQATA